MNEQVNEVTSKKQNRCNSQEGNYYLGIARNRKEINASLWIVSCSRLRHSINVHACIKFMVRTIIKYVYFI